MDLTAHESTVYWKRISIPKGLPALLEILAKEAIRENPEDLIGFFSKLIDDLIAKRDQEGSEGGRGNSGGGEKVKSDEENPLLEKNKQPGQSLNTKSDEDSAASKIQAGFRGYQTRKSLKSKKKGGHNSHNLSLTSLTPISFEDDDACQTEEESEQRRLEKAADEAIAAEIKTPLETIREESLDGNIFLSKTSESVLRNDNERINEEDIPKLKSDIIEDIAEVIEEAEDLSQNIAKELANIPNETEPKSEKQDAAETEPSIVANVNELLNAQGFSVSIDGTGNLVEMQETNHETLLDSKIISEENDALSEEQTDPIIIIKNKDDDDDEKESLKTEPSNFENNLTNNETEQANEQEINSTENPDTIIEENKNEIKDFVKNDENDEEEIMGVSESIEEKLETSGNEPHEIFGSLASVPDKSESSGIVKKVNFSIEKPEIINTETENLNHENDLLETDNSVVVDSPIELDVIIIDEIDNQSEEKDSEKNDDESKKLMIKESPESKRKYETKIQSIDSSESEKTYQGKYPESLEKSETSLETTPDLIIDEDESPPKEIPENVEASENIKSDPIDENDTTEIIDMPKPLIKSNSIIDNLENIAFIDDEQNVSFNNPIKSEMEDTNDPSNNNISVESPTLIPNNSQHPSFAKTDSASSSTTTAVTCVRPADLNKTQDSSQDTSSLSETLPVAKPRNKQTVVPSPEETSKPQDQKNLPEENAEESNEPLGELKPSEPPTPVLRRQKSSPKTRGRAVSSKYRSGIVMDDEISMEEMEAQIENEMMSQAATKIQAGFRGYKTRKSIRHSGVSFADDGVSKKKSKSNKDKNPDTTTTAVDDDDAEAGSPTTAAIDLSNVGSKLISCASASADESLPSTSKKGRKPPLAYLRSRSYPGSAEGKSPPMDSDDVESPSPLPDVELELDPTYMNNAAIKIQASVRGFLVRSSIKRKKNPKISKNSDDSSEIKELSKNDALATELIINPADRDSVSPVSEVESEMAAAKIQAAFRGYKDRQKVRQTKKAVVTIQATVRGFLTRRRLLKLRRRSMQRRRSSAKSMISHEVQKIQKANDAATKIQAVYRGYQVRSKIRRNVNDE